jgi:hypothetical protein
MLAGEWNKGGAGTCQDNEYLVNHNAIPFLIEGKLPSRVTEFMLERGCNEKLSKRTVVQCADKASLH